ncbi:phosphoglycerate kinase [Candidatus Ishikawella capsulata]|uniref:Phosphoglycerate kinase n=1 Tax=Candidatus Ishikawaella capsulata Mpkobe TaxID=476281 RepID=C5WCF8_9ENTR|nr:phosphoglycerate kinase [Candidatus Ishikawaella capsulata]BAH83014.1 phosphoglycerate kinase [Candidatus Ishikawaella capsulata Mpkobe]
MSVIKMTDLDLTGKRVLIRTDFNVPIKEGKIISDARIRSALPTIKLALKQGAGVIVASHLGRPIEGEYSEDCSLLPIVNYLKKTFTNTKVSLVKDYLHGLQVNMGELFILENVRFNKGEKKNDELLAQNYAALCDIFVMDAFATAHRLQASTHGVIKFAPIVCAGPLLLSELNALKKVMSNPYRPLVAIVGGSKVSTKFDVLQSLVKIADTVIVGGGIANTFIAIENSIGKSLYEPGFVESAKKLRDEFNIFIPIDSRVGKEFSETAQATIKKVSDLEEDDEIMDFGDETIQLMSQMLLKAKTILWNGPVGVFEFINFGKGTEAVANYVASSLAFSVAGGGDTIAAIEKFGVEDKISYISTGGGAFLNFIEGKTLPAVLMLEERAASA